MVSHPFAEHIALQVTEQRPGHSRLTLHVAPHHLNPNGVVHGAVLFALADTGMGSALFPTLTCETSLVNRGTSIANLESRVMHDGKLVASANGHYAILRAKSDA